MSYRSKRTMSAALSEDALERPKKATPPMVSQSSVATTTTPSETLEKPNDSYDPNPCIGTHTFSHMPSKGQSKWGPFYPPGNGVPTTLSPSFGTSGEVGSKSIWKIPLGTSNPKPTESSTSNPKPTESSTSKLPRTLNPKPMATQNGVPSTSSVSMDKNQSSFQKKEFGKGMNDGAAKQSLNNTKAKSDLLSARNVDEDQMHSPSLITTLPYTNSARKTIKSPNHVRAEMLQTRAQNNQQHQHTVGVKQQQQHAVGVNQQQLNTVGVNQQQKQNTAIGVNKHQQKTIEVNQQKQKQNTVIGVNQQQQKQNTVGVNQQQQSTVRVHKQQQHDVGETEHQQKEGASHTNLVQPEITVKTKFNKSNKAASSKSCLPFTIPGWPKDVEFDASDEVLTIDAKGDYHAISGPISAIDVLSSKGVKYIVEFNKNFQPIRKGGWVLVKFLGYIAKMGHYCPVGAENWHKVENHLKVTITNKMREHFVIPEEEIYNTLALQRVNKSWRHYKHELKRIYYQPLTKTKKQHYDPVPGGITPSDWIKLVDFWFSEKGQQLSEIGKEARSQQCQAHTLGSKSYANLRADYEEEHGEEMGLIECWEKSHMRKDGSFVEGTVTEDFLVDAKSKVEILKMMGASTSRVDLEDKAFHDVLNGGEIPERPQGFGFGVKKSDVYGVRGLLRKDGSGKAKMKPVQVDVNAAYSAMSKRNEELERKNQELSSKCDKNSKMMNTVVAQFSQILNAMRTGKATQQLFDAAQSALEMANEEVSDDDACGDGGSNEKEVDPSE